MSDPSSKAAHTVAITGAGGFIASHLTHLLLERGCRVRALVHYNASGSIGHLAEVIAESKKNKEAWSKTGNLEIIRGDILDERCIREVIHECDQVFHLAALIGVPYSFRAPESYLRTNVQGTLNVLEACREECPERLIITSTSEVYGTAREAPIREEHPLQAQSPYAASKIAADKFAESYGHCFGLPVVALRPFNTYGPRQTARGVVPAILSQLISKECSALRLGNLDTVRDLTYVEDTAAGFLALAMSPLEVVAGRTFNLGAGEGRSIGEIAQLAMKVLGVHKPIQMDEQRLRPGQSEVKLLLADSSRLRNEVGWSPAVDLEEGLLRTARWITRHAHLYEPEEYRI